MASATGTSDQTSGDTNSWTDLTVDGRDYQRRAVRTPWLGADDDLVSALMAYLPHLAPNDTVIVSEKVAVLLTGRAVDASTLAVGPLARLLAKTVRPRTDSRGLSVPEKMQYVVEHCGRSRILLAAAVGALTRPLGVRGMFYRVAGSFARDLDGARPPYGRVLFPPIPVDEAHDLCRYLQEVLGAGVAIVDLNDFGGSIRAASDWAIPGHRLLGVLADNPLGQRATSTPFGVVRLARSVPDQRRRTA